MSIMTQLAGMAVSAAIAMGTPYAPPYAPDQPQPYAACITEDSAGPCIWNANESGNGRGRSFVVTADQEVIYLDGKPAPTAEDRQR